MVQGALLTEYFLTEGIKETPEWKTADPAAVAAFATAAEAAYRAFPISSKPSETQTEDDLIFPVLATLGWTRDFWIAQVPAARKGRADVPDMLLFGTADDKVQANAQAEPADRYKFGLAIVENKKWDTVLDRVAKGKAAREGVPSNQILRYLSAAETQSDRRLQWGILTNGRFWRLYWQRAKSRTEDFLELDLPTLLGAKGGDAGLFTPRGAERDHWLKVFFLIFRREAFLPGLDGRSFHLTALAEGRLWEERVAKDLSALVFRDVFPALVQGLHAGDPEAPKAPERKYLSELREAAFILLYRLLFVLYAEDRNLLPVRSPRYAPYALRRLRQEVAERKDRLAAGLSTYYGNLKQLFRAISRGKDSLGLPPYNGGLFDPDHAPLLERAELDDRTFANVIDALSRHEVAGERHWINYRDLSVQQLGSIYEELLEFDLVLSGGKVAVAKDDTARKRSGSYYTPEELVGLIIERTVGPLLEERWRAFADKSAELAKQRRPKAERIKELSALDPARAFLELRVCDPAMGSGHFLVSLVDYLSSAVSQAMADATAEVEWADDEAPYVSPLASDIAQVRKRILDQAKSEGWAVTDTHLEDRQIVRRMILKRVVFGVDRNPMAVELAKVALWLHTFTVGAPLSFLDHHLRCGNSLFGEWVRPVEDELRKRGAMFLNRFVQQAKGAVRGMAKVESLLDADMGEVKESALTFDQVKEATAPLSGFLDFHHALRWLNPKGEAQKRGIQALYDGSLGNSVRIAAGLDPLPPVVSRQEDLLIAPATPSPTLLPGAVAVDDAAAQAALSELLSQARVKAEEERFLHWQVAFPGIWDDWESFASDGGWDGGFDAVIGNPPYVRQEMLTPAKPMLKSSFKTYDGSADLFVYFYEQGLKLLRPGGRLSYVVTNKWLKAGYGEALRKLFGERAWLEAVIDFGHAKQFFADADVFPCVIVARRPVSEGVAPDKTRIAIIARETLRLEALGPQIDREGYDVERTRFGAEAWLLEPPSVIALMDKIRAAGQPLAKYAGVEPLYGIKTGFNEAFLVDTTTKEQLIASDPKAADIMKPYMRGEDIERWSSPSSGMWMIVMKSSGDHPWPWAAASNAEEAENLFRSVMPALHRHFKQFEDALRKRQDQGRFWWELRPCAYYKSFDRPKILYQDITWRAQFAADATGAYCNNTIYFLPTDDKWALAVLNAPIGWWFSWRAAQHAKDEALRYFNTFVETYPVPPPLKVSEKEAVTQVTTLIEMGRDLVSMSGSLRDWLRIEHGIEKLPRRLQAAHDLTEDAFVGEVKKAKKSLSAAALRSLREEYARIVAPARKRHAEAQATERKLSDLVNAAYGLTPDDVRLMWETAPPRMPLPCPES